METTALRLYGVNDLRLETFELPEITENDILAEIVSNSICMSDHKAAEQGAAHKRVPNDCAENPIILGHEFCGRLLKVGKRWKSKFEEGSDFAIQPAIAIPGDEMKSPGYSFPYIGGHSKYVVIPGVVMERDSLLSYSGDAYFKGSLAEPISCNIRGFRSNYHYIVGDYTLVPNIQPGGAVAILAGAGPMGISSVDYALHGPVQPSVLVVTDIDQARLDRAASIFTPEHAKSLGIELHYVNTGKSDDPAKLLLSLTKDSRGYDDVFVFAPVAPIVEQASAILGFNGCLNFFAGPIKKEFSASINFYNVHYAGHHVVGSSGGGTQDLREALDLMSAGKIDPSVMVTHVGGITAAGQTTIDLPKIPGGKKLCYTHVDMPMTAIADFEALGKSSPFFADLATICRNNNMLWSAEAEKYLLANAKSI